VSPEPNADPVAVALQQRLDAARHLAITIAQFDTALLRAVTGAVERMTTMVVKRSELVEELNATLAGDARPPLPPGVSADAPDAG
jgi:hypothetical protein